MALLSFIFGAKKAKIGSVTIDASLREVHESSCDLTENPIESGADTTDHVSLLPKGLTIEGVVSDSPVSYFEIDPSTGKISTNFNFFGTSSRSKDAYDTLVALQETRTPFKVITGLKVYDNMILKDFPVTRSADIGKAINFTARLTQIRTATAETVAGTSLSADTSSRGAPTKDLGRKVTEKVPAESPISTGSSVVTEGTQQTKGASYLFKLMSGLRG